MVTCIASVFAIVGLTYSCSNAEPVPSKNAASSKTEVSSKKTTAKLTTGVTVSDSTKKTIVTVPKENRHIVVYYFHGNARCPTCFKLESYAKSEVEADFAVAIKKGTLEWKTINTEDKGNEHYESDYKLYSKSVIISIQENGKETSWKNLDKIWEVVHEEPKYREYIKNEVKACLEGKCL
jgi:hypothetical protein